MNILGIIPARYASSRFSGKPLADINGKSMIQRVYEQATKALKHVVVATDDKRIFDKVKSFDGEVVFTSEKHQSGTDRCVEALKLFSEQKTQEFDIVVNIQGDEPLISPIAIKELITAFEDDRTDIATLVNKQNYSENLNNTNLVKVVIKISGIASYFSRNLIPFVRNIEDKASIQFHTHLGIYAYKSNILKEISELKESNSEFAEKLEQNRWLDNDYTIKTITTKYSSIGVDTKNDIKKILELLNEK
ncbi:MAG: 3-deoxy-manno-octulosonate cytidylyltransferase [Bacteroidota bacterium]|nr:3-deoxy-manno-octulosonate cytidylyltransferase [Bacteroidota bacterium]